MADNDSQWFSQSVSIQFLSNEWDGFLLNEISF